MEDVIKIIQSFDEAKQAKIGRECRLQPSDEQMVQMLSEYPESRLSKLMRECAFVPKNDDCVQMLANLEPGSRNTVLARVNWEPSLSWLVEQVGKLNRSDMESIGEIISGKVRLPDAAVINSLRQVFKVDKYGCAHFEVIECWCFDNFRPLILKSVYLNFVFWSIDLSPYF